MLDILLKNAVIVTVNHQREILWNGAIAIKGSKIVDIGKSEVICQKYPGAAKTIDVAGKVIFPGLINTHNHLFQTLLKGLGDDMALQDWLRNMTMPCTCYLDEEDCYKVVWRVCTVGLPRL
jgi:5-methylthioadenosine/S-adenosylhomocysteine deaminase